MTQPSDSRQVQFAHPWTNPETGVSYTTGQLATLALDLAKRVVYNALARFTDETVPAGLVPPGPVDDVELRGALAVYEKKVSRAGGNPGYVVTLDSDSQTLKLAPAPTGAGGSGGSAGGATASSQGLVRLRGDLGGDADNPTVPGLLQRLTLEQVQDAVAAMIVGGNNISVAYDDNLGTLTITGTGTGTGTGGTTDPEVVRDTIGAALVAGAGVQIVPSDDANTITISAPGAVTGTDPETVRDVVAAALRSGPNVTITVDDAGDTITIGAPGVAGLTAEDVQDIVAAFIVPGANLTKSYDDAANVLTLSAAGGAGGATDPEVVRDTIAAALLGSSKVQIAVDDALNTITIATTATVNQSDAYLLDRGNHTGTPTIPNWLPNTDYLANSMVLRAGVVQVSKAAIPASATFDQSLWFAQVAAAVVAVPGKVAGLIVNARTTASLSLSWTATSTATSYEVQYRTVGATTWTSGGVVTGVTATVQGLAAGTNYEVRVTASNSGGAGTPSDTVTTNTTAAADVGIGQPTAVAATTSGQSATLSWAPPTTGAAPTGYRITRDGVDANGAGAYSTQVAASARSVTLLNLVTGTTYNLSIVALGVGVESTPVTVQATIAAPLTWISGASIGGDVPPISGFGSWRSQDVKIVGMYDDNNPKELYEITYNPGIYVGKYADWAGATDYAIGWGGLPSGATWAQAAAGQHNALWTQVLNKMKTEYYRIQRGQLYLRFAHEMNGSWYPWSVNSGNVADFKAAWRQFRTLQLQILPQAKLVFCLNGDSSPSGMSGFDMWPGDDNQVDVCAVDFYNIYPQVKTQAEWDAALNTTGRGLGAHRQFALSKGKPFALSEWGNNTATSEGWGEAPFWFEKMYQFFKANAGTGAGQVLYECYFNAHAAENGKWELYPDTLQPLGAARYQGLWNGTIQPTNPAPAPAGPTSAIVDSFDNNQDGWAPEGDKTNTMVSWEQTVKHDGTNTLAITRTNLANATGQQIKAGDNTTNSNLTNAAGSKLYLWVLVPSGAPGTNWRAHIDIQDASYTWTAGADTVLTPGTWVQISHTPPASWWTAHQAIGVTFTVDNPAAASATVYIDSLSQGA